MEVTELSIRNESDVGHVRRAVQRMASEIGFGAEAVARLGIATTELATNLVRHQTVDGRIAFGPFGGEECLGIELVAQDSGPGIIDVERALTDRQSTISASMGCGLGAVRRLMDEFDIYSRAPDMSPVPSTFPRGEARNPEPVGTLVTARKYLKPAGYHRNFAISTASRPYPGEDVNGDSSLVVPEDDGLLVAVADGMGHGSEAAKASQEAIAHVRENGCEDFASVFAELHEGLRRTRGTALTLVRILLGDRKLVHAGIGNVEARVHPDGSSSLLVKPGVLGAGRPPATRVNEMAWPKGATLVVYTDGILGRWSLDETPQFASRPVAMVSHLLLRRFARPNDDATLVVAREARC